MAIPRERGRPPASDARYSVGMKLLPAALLLAASALVSFAVPASRAEEAARAAQDPRLDDLAWMAGHWSAEVDGVRTEEAWLAPGGGLMLGVNRAAAKGRRASFEYLRIEERRDELVYIASPGGKGATDFPLADFGERFVLFENPAHDFPRTLRYELDDQGTLHVRAAGEEGGKERALEWHWTREP